MSGLLVRSLLYVSRVMLAARKARSARMPANSPQAKDISDDEIRTAIIATRGRNDVPRWATTWDIIAHLSEYPPKVVVAKLASCLARGVVQGHVCSRTPPYCRGDFEIADERNQDDPQTTQT